MGLGASEPAGSGGLRVKGLCGGQRRQNCYLGLPVCYEILIQPFCKLFCLDDPAGGIVLPEEPGSEPCRESFF